MRPVSPDLDLPEVAIARDQLEYMELTGAVGIFPNGSEGIITRWRLSDEERAAVAAGEDLYVSLLTFGGPVQPIRLQFGREGLPAGMLRDGPEGL